MLRLALQPHAHQIDRREKRGADGTREHASTDSHAKGFRPEARRDSDASLGLGIAAYAARCVRHRSQVRGAEARKRERPDALASNDGSSERERRLGAAPELPS